MGRKCSHFGDNNNVHNSRTCSNDITARSTPGGLGPRLFGVQLPADPSSSHVKKGFTTVKSSSASSPSTISSSAPSVAAAASSSSSSSPVEEATDKKITGSSYHLSSEALAQERKKGIPWTEEEHGRFLAGLAKLGKGDWRGISRYFVTTRTPTQVASHAQKYFLRRQTTTTTTGTDQILSKPKIGRRRRTSSSLLFHDVVDGGIGGGNDGARRRSRRRSTSAPSPQRHPRGKLDAGAPGDSTALQKIDNNMADRDGERSACRGAIDLNS